MVIGSGSENTDDAPESLSQPAWQYSGKDFLLSTGLAQVELRCDGELIDRVAYDQYSPGPASQFRGWQLSPSATDSTKNDDLHNWCYTSLPVMSENGYYGNYKVASLGRKTHIVQIKLCHTFMLMISKQCSLITLTSKLR